MGKIGILMCLVYVVFKYVFYGFFESLCVEVYEEGFYVCLICLGYVNINVIINVFIGDGLFNKVKVELIV